MEDKAIVDLYWDRNESAISETQNKYEKYLLKVAYNVLSNSEDSNEAVNDTYLHAWNSMPDNRPSILSTYLAKITRRVSIDAYRRKTAEKRGGSEYELSLQELMDSGFEPGTEVENESELEDLGKLISEYLKTISPEMRQVFIRRYFHMDSVNDICANFGFSSSKVKSMLMRARNGLAQYLKKEGYQV